MFLHFLNDFGHCSFSKMFKNKIENFARSGQEDTSIYFSLPFPQDAHKQTVGAVALLQSDDILSSS